MWGKMLKSIGKSLSHQPNCFQQKNNQDGCGTVHGADMAAQWANCSVCVEESEQYCRCDHNIEDAKSVEGDAINVGAEHDANANSSFAHAVINMVGMLIGLGQLSTPYAVEKGGWASALLLIGLGVMCAYSALILGKCLEKNPKLRSYVDIGDHAFGAKGRLLAATFIYMEIFMSLVSYTISLHDNLITVFLGTHLKLQFAKLSTSQLLTVAAVLLALPSLWLRDLSSISFLSTGGILMSLVVFVSVAATAIFGAVQANHSIPVFQLHKIPSISGIYIFGYGGHIVFPDLYRAMKDPSKFTKVSIVSFTIVTALYTTMGFMGAKMFGPEIDSQITLSMPPKLIVTKIALWATVLTPMTKYALEFAPFAIQLEQRLPNSMSGGAKMIVRGSVGSTLLLIILALALSVPYFEYVLSLTGSLVTVVICLIFPSAFYIKICWGQLPKPLLALNLCFILLGFLLGVMGTISSSKLLVQNIQGAH